MANNLTPLGIIDVRNEHSGDESDEDDDDVVEQSPCGRWEKRRQEVMQRDVPGIDHSFLAMDTEEGVEVVWNEVQFSERKSFKSQEENVKAVFENLIQLDHANIVKFYKFWTDTRSEKPRVIFITEYMTSGSLKQFLKKTRKSLKTLNEKVWKRWLRQILSALSYLHGCETPIVHGNLSCDTIFIQHNGLIKIGSVAPDTIHNHVKTYREEMRNMHFIAPEYGKPGHVIDCAVDIYAFGICALEMAALELHDNEGSVTRDTVFKAIAGLEIPFQQDFIQRCLAENPAERPTARDLLLHPSLFVVHPLKLLAAHCMVDNDVSPPDNREDTDPERVLATVGKEMKRGKSRVLELEKYLEEVRNGLFPLTGMQQKKELRPRQRPKSPEGEESVLSENQHQYDEETRRATLNKCQIKLSHDNADSNQQTQLELLLKLDDKMNRHLMCNLRSGDKGVDLADDLIRHGLLNKADREELAKAIQTQLDSYPVIAT
ncbi:nuclear receptor-binding protein-like [Stylophora pistillata]|uniref:nuclear receptor-binding protein-like n=1 Tax=Stylophora pistillata TaxID=50429 RepID=UPI000C03B792|nr:nuclear receptor-binding protein-like [Stylophora pistillata]